MASEYEYTTTLHACGEALPWELPGGWEYAGAYVRQGEGAAVTVIRDPEVGDVLDRRAWEGEPAPFLLATWRRPTPTYKSYETP